MGSVFKWKKYFIFRGFLLTLGSLAENGSGYQHDKLRKDFIDLLQVPKGGKQLILTGLMLELNAGTHNL